MTRALLFSAAILTFGSMAVVFFAIAALSSWLPARRAAALDPTIALRE